MGEGGGGGQKVVYRPAFPPSPTPSHGSDLAGPCIEKANPGPGRKGWGQVRSVAVGAQTAAADSARGHGELRAYERLPPKRCLPDVAVLEDRGTAKDIPGKDSREDKSPDLHVVDEGTRCTLHYAKGNLRRHFADLQGFDTFSFESKGHADFWHTAGTPVAG